MWRTLLPFALLFSPAAAPLLAQAPPEPPLGATIRWTDGGRTHQGRLVEQPIPSQPFHVVVAGSTDTILVSRTPGYRAWRSRGSQKLLGAGVGLGVGAVIGFAIGKSIDEDCTGWCFFDELGRTVGAGVGAVVGAGLGAIAFPGAQWTVLNQAVAVGVLLEPGRAGVRIAF